MPDILLSSIYYHIQSSQLPVRQVDFFFFFPILIFQIRKPKLREAGKLALWHPVISRRSRIWTQVSVSLESIPLIAPLYECPPMKWEYVHDKGASWVGQAGRKPNVKMRKEWELSKSVGCPFKDSVWKTRRKSRNVNISSGFLFRVKKSTWASPNTEKKKADIMSKWHSLCPSQGIQRLLGVLKEHLGTGS